jgi:hypothetical protein
MIENAEEMTPAPGETHRVTLYHLIGGAVTEAIHTGYPGQRVTFQHFPHGGALIRIYRDGRPIREFSYRTVETIERDLLADGHADSKADLFAREGWQP